MYTLKVGDILYRRNSQYNSLYKRTITRVTNKYAFVKVNDSYEDKLDIEQSNPGFIKEKNKERYSRSYYSVETPELADRYKSYIEKSIVLNKISKIDLSELKLETLKNIYDIITSEAK